jgi:hypothetical protein
MVGKLPNCSQARRSRTEERKRLMDPTVSPKSKSSYAPGTESQGCKRGLDVRNQILLADRKKYFCLDIPFYRTLPTLFGNPFRIPTLPRPRRRVRCLGATAKTSHNLNSSPQLRKGLVTDVPGPMCNGCSGTLTSPTIARSGALRMGHPGSWVRWRRAVVLQNRDLGHPAFGGR